MKIRMLALAALTALIGVGANAQAPFPPFSAPVGYNNYFGLGFTGGKDPYISGEAYGVADLIAETSDNETFVFKPNTLQYSAAVDSGIASNIIYWTDSTDGSPDSYTDGGKWIEANCYYETTLPIGVTNVSLTVTVVENSLDARYQQLTLEPRAFIKVLDSIGGGWGTLAFPTVTLSDPGSYNVQLEIADNSLAGQALQAGIVFEGQNAAPGNSWGSLTVTVNDLTITSGDTTPPPVPGFAEGPTALSDSSIGMTATTVVDPEEAPVEYMFTNTTLNYDSGWLSDTNWVDLGPIGPETTGDVENCQDRDYAVLDGVWEGWAGGAQTPSSFVTVNAGVATVTPNLPVEFDFYQTFGVSTRPALTLGQAYRFTIVSDNSTLNTTNAVAFVKAFNGGWGEIGAERIDVPLPLDGSTTTIDFTPVSGVFYQIGTYTIGVGGSISGSYQVSNPSLLALDAIVPGTPVGLPPDTLNCYKVRSRDTSVLQNVSDWSAESCVATLPGDGTPPPTPAFDITEGSPQSVKMTVTPVVDPEGSAVEYYFECVAGDGEDSGWQSSPVYIDTGLASSSNFTYRVRARDVSAATNTSAWSATTVIATLDYPLSVALANDLKGFTGNSNQDGTVHEILKANLEFADYLLPRRIVFGSEGATFGSATAEDGGRNIIRTLANQYDGGDFTVSVDAKGFGVGAAVEQIFIGFGPGILGAYGVPDWSPNGENTNAAVICQLDMVNNVAGIWAQTNNSTGNWAYSAEQPLALVSNTIQRIELSYDSSAQQATVSIDEDFTGTFSPTVVIGPVAVPALTQSKIYIAGDDGITLYNLEIVADGTAPIVGVDSLMIQVTGSGKVLTWSPTTSAQTYDVEVRSSLTAGDWAGDVTGIAGQDGSMSVTSLVDTAEAFFRVGTQ